MTERKSVLVWHTDTYKNGPVGLAYKKYTTQGYKDHAIPSNVSLPISSKLTIIRIIKNLPRNFQTLERFKWHTLHELVI